MHNIKLFKVWGLTQCVHFFGNISFPMYVSKYCDSLLYNKNMCPKVSIDRLYLKFIVKYKTKLNMLFPVIFILSNVFNKSFQVIQSMSISYKNT